MQQKHLATEFCEDLYQSYGLLSGGFHSRLHYLYTLGALKWGHFHIFCLIF